MWQQGCTVGTCVQLCVRACRGHVGVVVLGWLEGTRVRVQVWGGARMDACVQGHVVRVCGGGGGWDARVVGGRVAGCIVALY